jgi:hypothetical protein
METVTFLMLVLNHINSKLTINMSRVHGADLTETTKKSLTVDSTTEIYAFFTFHMLSDG